MIRQYGMALLLSCLMMVPVGVKAACSFKSGTNYITELKTYTMPVSATISVTPGLSVGQQVFQQNLSFSGQGRVGVVCDSPAEYFHQFDFSFTPSSTELDSVTYPTGIPGIGIRFKYHNYIDAIGTDFPGARSISNAGNCVVTSTNCEWSAWGASSWFQLVKTGPVTPGVINMNTFPELVYSMGQSGSMLEVYRIKMSGTVTVTVPTCNIVTTSKAMTVNLGKHKLVNFSGTSSVSGWVDASIHLEGCGQFYGTAISTWATFNGTSLNPGSALTPNQFSITLTPRDGVESVSGKGVMKIKQQQGGAVGFGIQLSRSQSDAGVMNLTGASYTYADPLPANGSSTVTVPLYARYIRTAATAYAGRADGMLEYTVSYK